MKKQPKKLTKKQVLNKKNSDLLKATYSAKIYPRLRMMSNGQNKVNKIRSELNATVKYHEAKTSLPFLESNSRIAAAEMSATPIQIPEKTASQNTDRGKRKDDPPVDTYFNIYITLKQNYSWKDVVQCLFPKAKKAIYQDWITRPRQHDNVLRLEVRATELEALAKCPYIEAIEGSQAVLLPPPIKYSYSNASKPIGHKFHNEIHPSSEPILIGIIDVGGFDFAHPDFINSNKTRFHSIWDQKGGFRPNPETTIWNDSGQTIKAMEGLNYGSVILQSHMNKAIHNAPIHGIPVHSIEPQSQQYPSSHATHVTSIAAGNSGVCPQAEIIGVLISLPVDHEDRRATFTDSSRIVDAVDYLNAIAHERDLPISINISLGTNGHAHDGSSPVNRWIDSILSQPKRALTVATGNAGQEKGLFDGDFGYIMGRIHTAGRISHAGLMTDLEWQVIGDGNQDISENELEIWYEPQDRFSVMIKPPGEEWIGPIGPQQVIENLQLKDDSFISVYNKIYYNSNGNNHISIYLSPFFGENEIVGIKPGLWKVRLIGDEIRDGRFDAWIERDDFTRRSQEYWNFPSFFSENTNVDEKSINSLACGHNVIAVGNFDSVTERINITSSQGPTRDNRTKPEIIAPGTDIVAANGFAGNDALWIAMTGTSMASPYACGAAALLLQRSSELTSAQIAGILKRTSIPLPDIGYEWRNDIGYGLINIQNAIDEAEVFTNHEDITELFE